MGLHLCSDLSPAAWLVESPVDPDHLITVGPDGFQAYARLRFIPDPSAPGQPEPTFIDPPLPPHLSLVKRGVHVLAQFTTTPLESYFCHWDGYTDLDLPPNWPLVDIPPRAPVPLRSFALFRGKVTDIDEWGLSWSEDTVQPPAFVWPADRAWCFTHDVDPHWAVIAASRPAVDALLATPGLDIVEVQLTDVMPTYYSWS